MRDSRWLIIVPLNVGASEVVRCVALTATLLWLLKQAHVCGEFCDECLPGFYNLRADNPAGCDPCFCFGVTDQCVGSSWGRDMVSNTLKVSYCLVMSSCKFRK